MILTVTLNPAVDEEYLLPDYRVGRWNSVVSSQRTPGGSGVNVAIMLRQLGHETGATGFLAGYNGDFLRDALRDHRVTTNFVTLEGETRTNVNLIDLKGNVETCILEGGPSVSEEALEAFYSVYSRMLGRSSAVVIGGDVPPGVPDDVYARLIAEAHRTGLSVYLNAEGLVQQRALEELPYYVNFTPRHLLGETGVGMDRSRAVALLQRARQKGIAWSVASCLDEGELFACSAGIWLAALPLEGMRSLFTFDDAVTSGLVSATLEGGSPEEVIRFAMACGLEDSTHDLKGLSSRSQVEAQMSRVILTPVS